MSAETAVKPAAPELDASPPGQLAVGAVGGPPGMPAPRHHRRLAVAAAIATAVIAVTAAGMALGSGGAPKATPDATTSPGYTYYESVMGRYQWGSGPMMGGMGGPMMAAAPSYAWMMGGKTAPGWMTGATLPAMMTAGQSDPGKVMGSLFADAPGPRVSVAAASSLGSEVAANASVDAAADTVTFSGASVRFAVVAGAPGSPDETFRLAGLVNPTVVVGRNAQVTVEVVNADPDSAHGLVVAASAGPSAMPMMNARPAFAGASVWFLGDPTGAGLHAATVTFGATTPGRYPYFCPVPGHAAAGMEGTFVVNG